jgi:hypothetical protein
VRPTSLAFPLSLMATSLSILKSAIFSAIITPFLAESYKLLGLHPSPPFFGRDGYTVRVNAMWFGSLILSLIAGLFSIHCKMWLDGYGVRRAFTTMWSANADQMIGRFGICRGCKRRSRQRLSSETICGLHYLLILRSDALIISALSRAAKILYPRNHWRPTTATLRITCILCYRSHRLPMAP